MAFIGGKKRQNENEFSVLGPPAARKEIFSFHFHLSRECNIDKVPEDKEATRSLTSLHPLDL